MMTSSEALIGLPNGDVTRTASVARLIPSQKWRKEAVLNITGTPARPTASGYDDSIIESFSNPNLLLDDEQRALLDDDEPRDIDLPLCLHVDRKLPSLRLTKSDLERYGYTAGCPRCQHTQMGMSQLINSNHGDSCRRRIYRQMYVAKDAQLTAWLRSHPTDTAKVGPSIGLPEPTPGAASSTSPGPSSGQPGASEGTGVPAGGRGGERLPLAPPATRKPSTLAPRGRQC